MTDDPIGEALRKFPRESAGERFTERVLERLGHERYHSRFSHRRYGIATILVLLALVLVGVFRWEVARRGKHEQARLEQIRAEQRRLRKDLLDLRRMERESAPVIYLGGDDQVDLVLDPRRFPVTPPPAKPGPQGIVYTVSDAGAY